MNKHTIFVNEDVVVDYYTHDTPSKDLVFTANGVWPRMIEDGLVVMDGMGYYGKEIYNKGHDIVAIKNKAYDYYSNLSAAEMSQIKETLQPLIQNKYERRLYFGGCASSWLGLVLSKYFEFDLAVLLMPRNELLPEDCDNLGISVKIDLDKDIVYPKCHFILCCNFNHEWDVENLTRFANVIDNKTVLNIPDDSEVHDIMQTLKRHKIWKQFFYNMVVHGSIMEHEAIIKV